MKSKLQKLIPKTFPKEHLRYCCAYGSGIFKQSQQSEEVMKKNVIDLIVVVDDTYEFHRKNMKINKKHYSFISKIMPAHITEFVQRRGTKIFYNPMVKFHHCEDGLTYKYGVMHEKDFIHDLLNWREFYVSARLQKPVMTIYNHDDHSQPESRIFDKALEVNKQNAFALGLMMLPKPYFTLMDAFLSVAQLSYIGDIRMNFKAENPNKVKNIVEPNFEHFMDYYEDVINRFEEEKIIEYNDNSIFNIRASIHCYYN